MSKIICIALFTIGLVGVSSQAMAASYSISPLMLVASPTDKILTFRLTNTSQQVESIQVQVQRWQQVHGVDHYTRTFDLLPTPATATVKSHRSQYFRLGVRMPNHSTTMKAYRLFVRELPTQLIKTKVAKSHGQLPDHMQAKMHVLFDVSLPILIQPKGPLKEQFTWYYQALKGNDKYRIQVRNTGNVVLKLSHIMIAGQNQLLADKPLLQYLLPGATHQWVFTLKDAPKQIIARVNGQKIRTDLAPMRS